MLFSPNQEPPEEKKGKMYLINPSVKEFTTTLFDDNNKTISVTLAPLETKAFPAGIGRTILTHLVNFILNQGGFAYKSDIKEELAEIRKKCVVYE